MGCDFPPRQCLEWHIRPHLDSPKRGSDGESYKALCPAHADSTHSLGISTGNRQPLIWQCFAGCTRTRIRAVWIERGVPPGCLPLVTKEREDLLDTLRTILAADTADHAQVRLRALAVLEGYADLPRGGELERLAGLAKIHAVTAYRARKTPLPATDNPSSYPPAQKPVKSRRPRASPDLHGATN